MSTFQVVLVHILNPIIPGNPAPMPSQGLAMSTFQVVLVPTVLGVLTNELFPNVVKALKPVLPLIGVALTTLLCASPCAQVATILKCAPCHTVAHMALDAYAFDADVAEVPVNAASYESALMLQIW